MGALDGGSFAACGRDAALKSGAPDLQVGIARVAGGTPTTNRAGDGAAGNAGLQTGTAARSAADGAPLIQAGAARPPCLLISRP